MVVEAVPCVVRVVILLILQYYVLYYHHTTSQLNHYAFILNPEMKQLCKLETLSLAHNALDDASFADKCPLHRLASLKKLDLSRNSLTCVPLFVGNLTW